MSVLAGCLRERGKERRGQREGERGEKSGDAISAQRRPVASHDLCDESGDCKGDKENDNAEDCHPIATLDRPHELL